MLEKLFASKNRVKMLKFFLFDGKTAHLREIARQTSMQPSAAKREIGILLSLGVIRKDKERYVAAEQCSFSSELCSLLAKTDFAVEPIRGKLLNHPGLKFAFIFGSIASGKSTGKSDIDLLIIGKTSLKELGPALSSAEKTIGKEINAVIWGYDELLGKKSTGFVRDIAKGRIIMLVGDEDELRGIIGTGQD